MTDYDAIGICEGFVTNPGKTKEDQDAIELEAWQHLINTGLCWQLQGWFGRRAHALLTGGACTPAKEEPS